MEGMEEEDRGEAARFFIDVAETEADGKKREYVVWCAV